MQKEIEIMQNFKQEPLSCEFCVKNECKCNITVFNIYKFLFEDLNNNKDLPDYPCSSM